MNNRLSIITVNFNNAFGLRYTAESIKSQTDHSFEWVVIDAASTDDSLSVIKEYTDQITYYVSEPDGGIYDGMNKGIKKSNGDYLLFLNSGDSLADSLVVERLLKIKFWGDVVLGSVNICDSNQNVKLRNHSIKQKELSLFGFYLWGIPHQASLIKRTLFEEFGGYDQSLGMNADWKFFLDTLILSNKSLQKIEITIANYDNTGVSTRNIDKVRIERQEIFQKFVPNRITNDYLKVFPNYYEVYRIEWLLKHKFFYKCYRGLTTLGRKLLGD